MGILEQVMQMKSQGFSEGQIADSLRQQGISPKQITDALAQSQIKNAISGEEGIGMEPSIMESGVESAPQMSTPVYSPQTREISPQPTYQDQYAPQEGYYEDYSQGTSSTGTDTIIEIAEQVFSEKIQKLQTKIKEINDFKNLAEIKIDSVENRLKRIESVMDKLQIEILGKVGSYGETLQGIKKEMSMMQDSFGKTLKKNSSESESKLKRK